MSSVKGFLKYISQIFENEKEQDIQIGFPTDVKHVAHIGWDGPSVNSPSWMNDFKTAPGFSSTDLDIQNKGQDNAKWVNEDQKRRGTKDIPDLPKASKRQPMSGATDSPSREKSNKPRQSGKPANKTKGEGNPTRAHTGRSPQNRIPVSTDNPPAIQPDIPKKTRRHRSKENSSPGPSSKLRSKAQSGSDSGSPIQVKTRNKPRSCEENE